MSNSIRQRLELLRSSINRPIAQIPLGFISVVSVYDVVTSQMLPAELSRSMPKVWEMIVLADDYIPSLPPFGWLAVLAVLVALVTIEYGVSLRRPVAAPAITPAPAPAPAASEFKGSYYGEPKKTHAKKPRYALPDDAKDFPIGSVSNKDLGKILSSVGNDIASFLRAKHYNATEEQIIGEFHRKIAPRLLWAYQEAKDRGFDDSGVEGFYKTPEELRADSLEWIGKSLVTMGSRVGLYAD